MSKPYCGAGKIPKDAKRGSAKECAQKGQIRYYGLKRIDSKTLEEGKAERKKGKPETRDELMIKMAGLRGVLAKNTRFLEGNTDEDKKKPYQKKVDETKKKLEVVVNKIKKLEKNERKYLV